MDLAIHIPHWILWTLGIGGGLVVLGLAIFGFIAIRALIDFENGLGRWFGW